MSQAHPSLGFSSRIEHYPGEKLAGIYQQHGDAYRRWFDRTPSNISIDDRRKKLDQYMPELLPTYDALCHALGGDEKTCAFLSFYNPPAFRSGCSQAVRIGDTVELVRNYDYPSKLSDRLLLYSEWNSTKVIAMSDCLFGVVDGMNEHGLTVSLSFGGRDKRCDGFAITLVLRYILEFCQTTEEAIEVLQRVPVHMAYNITLVDAAGVSRTVAICPGQEPVVSSLMYATNHQAGGETINLDALADSYSREDYLSAKLSNKQNHRYSLVQTFLRPPLLRQAGQWNGWGTLYTAQYCPLQGEVRLYWPRGQVFKQGFEQFYESDIWVSSIAYQ